MKVKIFVGKTNRDSLKAVVEKLKHRDKTQKHILITPDRNALNIENFVLENLSEDCVTDITISTFSRFSNQIIQRYNSDNKKMLSKSASIAIIKNILTNNMDKLSYYKKAINYNGFCSELYETICMFKSCGVRPTDIVETNNNFLNLKLKDIKLTYEKFEEFLKNRYTDSFNKLILCSKLINSDLKNTNFYFIDFSDLNFQMYQIILALIKNSSSVNVATIANCFDELNNRELFVNAIYYNIIDLCKQLGVYCDIEKCSLVDYVKDNLYGYSIIKNVNYERVSDYKLCVCDNKHLEIDNLILKIKKLFIDGKIKSFNDIVVCVSDLNLYYRDLENALIVSNLPYYLDKSSSIKDNIVVRAISNILELLCGNYDKHNVLSLLNNVLFNFDDSVFEYNNFINKYGLQYASLIDKSLLNKNIIVPDSLKNVFLFFAIILKYKSKIDSLGSVESLLSILRELFDEIKFEDRVLKLLNKLKQQGLIIEFRNLDKVCEKIKQAFNEILEVFKNEQLSLEGFKGILDSYFEDISVSQPPISIDSIFVGDINNSYFTPCKYLFVLGANEGNFPTYSQDLGIVSDKEIGNLDEKNKITPTIALINKRRKFKVYELMFMADVCTYISYCSSDENGVEQYQNSFITSLMKLDAISEVEYAKQTNLSKCLVGCDDDYCINNLNYDTAKNNFVFAIKNWNSFSSNVGFRAYVDYLASVLNKECDKVLELNKFRKTYFNLRTENNGLLSNNSISISQFETFFKCPYMHLVRYGLKLKDEEKAELQAKEFGDIIHSFLAISVKELCNKSNYDDTSIDDIVKKSFDVVRNMENFSYIFSNKLNAFLINSLEDECFRVLKAINNQQKLSNFRPMKNGYEIPFSKFSNAIKFNIGDKEIVLKGIIDRVDLCDDYFRVIDYKTGSDSFTDFTDLYNGKKIQLIVYMKVFGDSHKNLKPAGAFYLPIKNSYSSGLDMKYQLSGVIRNEIENILNFDGNLNKPNYRSPVVNLATKSDCSFVSNSTSNNLLLSEEQMNYICDFAFKLMSRAVEKMNDGVIDAVPLEDDNFKCCAYCDYKGLCYFDESFNCKTKKVVKVKNISELKNIIEKENEID